MLKEFFLGFIKIHILYHASIGPVCGVEMMEELQRHGYHLSPGTLYPTMHRMERDGYLQSGSRVVSGKARRYYTITARGLEALAEARRYIGELVREVVEEDI